MDVLPPKALMLTSHGHGVIPARQLGNASAEPFSATALHNSKSVCQPCEQRERCKYG